MMQQAISRMSNNDFGNNNHGDVQIIMSYADDDNVNALVPTCGIQVFMTLFKIYRTLLGAIMNTEKNSNYDVDHTI